MGAASTSLQSPRYDSWTSLVATSPVFLIYHLGVIFSDLRNGVDFFTEVLVRLAQHSLEAYVGLTLLMALVFVGLGASMRRGKRFEFKDFLSLLGESVFWSIFLWVVVSWAVVRLEPGMMLAPRGGGGVGRFHGMGVFDCIVAAAGAGFHEELVFRAGLFEWGCRAFERWLKMRRFPALIWAGGGSALAFSAIHYLGPFGDDFTWASFLFRWLMGVGLAVLYRVRGFAVSVYTHVFYDLWVFFLLKNT
ncbi:MAG: CPBP family glutamic-type intramembrane protease [Sandaracinaceae bacterium]|nr:CPBP family glutamic-type intramembrane protease [Sandaracinaceae bacterium]